MAHPLLIRGQHTRAGLEDGLENTMQRTYGTRKLGLLITTSLLATALSACSGSDGTTEDSGWSGAAGSYSGGSGGSGGHAEYAGSGGTSGDTGGTSGGAGGDAASGGAGGSGPSGGAGGSAASGGAGGSAASGGTGGSAASGGTGGSGGGTAGSAGTGPTQSATTIGVEIDTAATGLSNTNGVFEPGETVTVAPRVRNDGAAANHIHGSTLNFQGPAGATYAIADGSADYGVVQPLSEASCLAATGDTYSLRVNSTGARPALHWDTTVVERLSSGQAFELLLHVGHTFDDVPDTAPYYWHVEALVHHEATVGCGNGMFRPAAPIVRGEMAAFLAIPIAGGAANLPSSGNVPGKGAYDCTAGGTSVFSDVPATHMFCRHVHYLAAVGLILGCGSSTFCPDGDVSRGTYAIVLARGVAGSDAAVPNAYTDSLTGRSYDCSPGSSNLAFSDVTTSDAYCRHVHYAWAIGATSGCGNGEFCPNSAATRAEAAVLTTDGYRLGIY